MTSGSLRIYYRDQLNDDENENDANEDLVNSNKIMTSKSFNYKTKLIGSTPNIASRLNAEVFVPLKYLSNFLRPLDFPLINYEIELNLSCSRNCVITEISRTFNAIPNSNPVWY